METDRHQRIDFLLKAIDLMNSDQSAGDMNDHKENYTNLGLDVIDPLPKLHSSAEPEITKRNKSYDRRKSLVWDSAFFTSSGVLDPEELSRMIAGAEKEERQLSYGIEDDITGSTESISACFCDDWTLEFLEDDLFFDIRASIQRSSRKASNFTNKCSKTAVLDNGYISPLRKQDLSSQNKNPELVLAKTSGLQNMRKSKCQPKQDIAKPRLKKALKQDSIHSQINFIAKIVNSNSALPKATNGLISTSTAIKRKSKNADRVNSECGSSKLATVSSKETPPTKVSAISGARKAFPKSSVLSRSSSLSSLTTSRMQSASVSTLYDNSSSISSKTPVKSPQLPAISGARKAFPKSAVLSRSSSLSSLTTSRMQSASVSTSYDSSCSISSKTPVKSPQLTAISGARKGFPEPAVSSKSSSLSSLTKSKLQSTSFSTSYDSSSSISSKPPVKSPLLTARRNLVKSNKTGNNSPGSVPKTSSRTTLKNRPPSSICSSVSPASSINERSSSSFSLVNRRSNKSRTNADAISCTSMDDNVIMSDHKSHYTNPNISGHQNQKIASLGCDLKKSLTRSRSLQAPVKSPSRLLLPSPTIGFFDWEKSLFRTPNGHPHSRSGSHSVFPYSRAQEQTQL